MRSAANQPGRIPVPNWRIKTVGVCPRRVSALANIRAGARRVVCRRAPTAKSRCVCTGPSLLARPERGSGPSPFADGPPRWVSARHCLSSCHPTCSPEARAVFRADPHSTLAGVAAAEPQEQFASVAAQATLAERPSVLPPPWAVAVAALLRVVDVGFPCPVARLFARCSGDCAGGAPEQPEEQAPLWPVQRPAAVAALLRVGLRWLPLPGCSAFARCSGDCAGGAGGATGEAGATWGWATLCGGGSVATGCAC